MIVQKPKVKNSPPLNSPSHSHYIFSENTSEPELQSEGVRSSFGTACGEVCVSTHLSAGDFRIWFKCGRDGRNKLGLLNVGQIK